MGAMPCIKFITRLEYLRDADLMRGRPRSRLETFGPATPPHPTSYFYYLKELLNVDLTAAIAVDHGNELRRLTLPPP